MAQLNELTDYRAAFALDFSQPGQEFALHIIHALAECRSFNQAPGAEKAAIDAIPSPAKVVWF